MIKIKHLLKRYKEWRDIREVKKDAHLKEEDLYVELWEPHLIEPELLTPDNLRTVKNLLNIYRKSQERDFGFDCFGVNVVYNNKLYKLILYSLTDYELEIIDEYVYTVAFTLSFENTKSLCKYMYNKELDLRPKYNELFKQHKFTGIYKLREDIDTMMIFFSSEEVMDIDWKALVIGIPTYPSLRSLVKELNKLIVNDGIIPVAEFLKNSGEYR